MEHTPPALESKILTTGPPKKFLQWLLKPKVIRTTHLLNNKYPFFPVLLPMKSLPSSFLAPLYSSQNGPVPLSESTYSNTCLHLLYFTLSISVRSLQNVVSFLHFLLHLSTLAGWFFFSHRIFSLFSACINMSFWLLWYFFLYAIFPPN